MAPYWIQYNTNKMSDNVKIKISSIKIVDLLILTFVIVLIW